MTPFDQRARAALIVVCSLLVLSSIGFRAVATALDVILQKQPVELRNKLDTMPTRLGDFEILGASRKLSAEIIEELGTNDYVDRTYAPHGKLQQGAINLHVTYYTGLIDAVPHVPDRCLVAAGFEIEDGPENVPLDIDTSAWREDDIRHAYFDEPYPVVEVVHPVTRTRQEVRLPVGDYALRVTEFRDPESRSIRVFSGYLFIANGAVAVTPYDVRLISFRPSEQFAYYCKIQFTVLRAINSTRDDFIAESTELLEALLPELMQCLPDWSEVEAGQNAP